jgi:hypothetical protein
MFRHPDDRFDGCVDFDRRMPCVYQEAYGRPAVVPVAMQHCLNTRRQEAAMQMRCARPSTDRLHGKITPFGPDAAFFKACLKSRNALKEACARCIADAIV